MMEVCNALSCARWVTHALATGQMFILPPLLCPDTLWWRSVYTRRLRALRAFRGTKAFRCIKAFGDSEANPMSSLTLNWYINTHPHMHKAEASERVRVSSFSNLFVCLYPVCVKVINYRSAICLCIINYCKRDFLVQKRALQYLKKYKINFNFQIISNLSSKPSILNNIKFS